MTTTIESGRTRAHHLLCNCRSRVVAGALGERYESRLDEAEGADREPEGEQISGGTRGCRDRVLGLVGSERTMLPLRGSRRPAAATVHSIASQLPVANGDVDPDDSRRQFQRPLNSSDCALKGK